MSLSKKILCLALLNLLLLGGVLLAFARSQFRFGRESLLMGPAHDRIRSIADSFAMEYETMAPSETAELLTQYGSKYGAEFFLMSPRDIPLAGPDPHLPDEVVERMRRTVPPPPARRPRPDGPPPRRRGPPPEDGPPPPERKGPPPEGDARPLPPESVFLAITSHPTLYWSGARVPVPDARGSYAVLVIRTTSIFNSKLFFNWSLWLGAMLSVVGVTVLVWVPFLRALTRSIAKMDRATQQIAEGRFDIEVDGHRRDELGHLGAQVNRMSARLQSFVKNQKRFLGDIAHELCAPIARIQFALGILEQKAADEDQAHVARLHSEIQEMSALVNELLSFSKAGLQMGSAPLTAVAVEPLVERAIARESVRNGAVQAEIEPELTAMANEPLLVRALSNLLRNAIRYAGDAGPITVRAAADGKDIEIRITDCGPGLPESELEEVFAPFYRPEAARTRETGGAGLGLAIVRTCIETCEGTVTCRNRKPSGLEVLIRLAAA